MIQFAVQPPSPLWTIAAVAIGGLISVVGHYVAGWLADRRALRAARVEALGEFIGALRHADNLHIMVCERIVQGTADIEALQDTTRLMVEVESKATAAYSRVQTLFPRNVALAAEALHIFYEEETPSVDDYEDTTDEQHKSNSTRMEELVENLLAEARWCLRGVLGILHDNVQNWWATG